MRAGQGVGLEALGGHLDPSVLAPSVFSLKQGRGVDDLEGLSEILPFVVLNKTEPKTCLNN